MDLDDDNSQALIQVPFTIDATDDVPSFTDALYFTPEEYAALTPRKLETAKKARYTSWLAAIAPQEPVEVPREEQIEQLRAQVASMQAELDALAAGDV